MHVSRNDIMKVSFCFQIESKDLTMQAKLLRTSLMIQVKDYALQQHFKEFPQCLDLPKDALNSHPLCITYVVTGLLICLKVVNKGD